VGQPVVRTNPVDLGKDLNFLSWHKVQTYLRLLVLGEIYPLSIMGDHTHHPRDSFIFHREFHCGLEIHSFLEIITLLLGGLYSGRCGKIKDDRFSVLDSNCVRYKENSGNCCFYNEFNQKRCIRANIIDL
jgi:hypothetical protein